MDDDRAQMRAGVPVSNRLGRGFRWVVRRLGRYRWFAVVMARVLPPTDRVVHRLTGGRATVADLIIPVALVTTTGRRSGLPRETPLCYVETGDGALAVVASNFGQESHPAWSENLLADPTATVTLDGATWSVRARPADEEERARLWPAFDRAWPPYRVYRERTSHRGIRMFVLEPVGRADPRAPQA